MIEEKFLKLRPNEEKLIKFGFEDKDGDYIYRRKILGGELEVWVWVERSGGVSTSVLDVSGEEYFLHKVQGAVGEFVGKVRTEYETVVLEIAKKCFEGENFKERQTNEVIKYIFEKYGDEPEYLWEKTPDNAIVRRSDNRKWYAALLTVSKRKLGLDFDENFEIINLRIKPEDMKDTVDGERIFVGYHMNKRNWISVRLDGAVEIEKICKMVDESYIIALKK